MQRKTSSYQLFKFKIVSNILLFSITLFGFSFSSISQEVEKKGKSGEELFKTFCVSCHAPFVDATGPMLHNVREKWEKAGEPSEAIIEWVRNWESAAAKYPYAKKITSWSPSAMTNFASEGWTDEEVTAILDYVDKQVPSTGSGDAADNNALGEAGEEEEGASWFWYILGALFITIIFTVGGVSRQLKKITSESSDDERPTYAEEFRRWSWKNRKYVGIGSIFIVMSLLVILYNIVGNINVMEGYQPSQPIAFPHSVHAGINGIDCKYCHNSVEKSKSAGIPSVNVCMNCHKYINGKDAESGEDKEFRGEILKIYEAAGWDESKKIYTGEEKPIVWNKVHVLPDHVYFNHSQHVVAGGLDCAQCHGNMKEMKETAMVQPHEVLNEVKENIDAKIKFTKPTLTMGWCIECHGNYKVDIKGSSNPYYMELHERLKKEKGHKTYKRILNDDDKVSVAELGGWECAKCHY